MIEMKLSSDIPRESGYHWVKYSAWEEPEIGWVEAWIGGVTLTSESVTGVNIVDNGQNVMWQFCRVPTLGRTVLNPQDCAIVIEPSGEFYGLAPKSFQDGTNEEATRGESLFTALLCLMSDENFVETRLAMLEAELAKPAS